jgi:hypothetical protein
MEYCEALGTLNSYILIRRISTQFLCDWKNSPLRSSPRPGHINLHLDVATKVIRLLFGSAETI